MFIKYYALWKIPDESEKNWVYQKILVLSSPNKNGFIKACWESSRTIIIEMGPIHIDEIVGFERNMNEDFNFA